MLSVESVNKISHIPQGDVSADVVDCAFSVHKQMGIGLLESVYEECFCYMLAKRGVPFERQKAIPVMFEGQAMGLGFKADILVNGSLIVEIKSVDRLTDIHAMQIMNYMRLSSISTGLLVNFNSKMFKEGIRRFVL